MLRRVNTYKGITAQAISSLVEQAYCYDSTVFIVPA